MRRAASRTPPRSFRSEAHLEKGTSQEFRMHAILLYLMKPFGHSVSSLDINFWCPNAKKLCRKCYEIPSMHLEVVQLVLYWPVVNPEGHLK